MLRSHRWRTAANSAGYLTGRLGPGASLLDVGCGPGTITADLAELAGGGRVIGIDPAATPLAEARELAASRGLATLEFEQGDVRALRFAAGSFDVVHAHQVLQHLADPVAALAEMRRVARPGGIVAARDSDYGGMLWHPADPELDEWRELYRQVARATGGEPDAGRRLLGWAQAAGLGSVEPSASCWCFATVEERGWWGGLWAERLVHSGLADQAVGHGLATLADLERLAAAWRRWQAAPDGWFLVPHGEILCTA
ncbi:MAG TPA: methyltransferase domain-containing protein [Streptosporangiaceae bacterium]